MPLIDSARGALRRLVLRIPARRDAVELALSANGDAVRRKLAASEIWRREIADPMTAGILLYGSAARSLELARDVDLLVLRYRVKPAHRFLVVDGTDVSVCIENLSMLQQLFDQPRFNNWEIEVGKLVNGEVLFDPSGELRRYRSLFTELPRSHFMPAMLHHIGNCVDLANKLLRRQPSAAGQAYLVQMVSKHYASFVLLALRSFPASANLYEELPPAHREAVLEYQETHDFGTVARSIRELVIRFRGEFSPASRLLGCVRYPTDVEALRFVASALDLQVEVPASFDTADLASR